MLEENLMHRENPKRNKRGGSSITSEVRWYGSSITSEVRWYTWNQANQKITIKFSTQCGFITSDDGNLTKKIIIVQIIEVTEKKCAKQKRHTSHILFIPATNNNQEDKCATRSISIGADHYHQEPDLNNATHPAYLSLPIANTTRNRKDRPTNTPIQRLNNINRPMVFTRNDGSKHFLNCDANYHYTIKPGLKWRAAWMKCHNKRTIEALDKAKRMWSMRILLGRTTDDGLIKIDDTPLPWMLSQEPLHNKGSG
jgi:hypothetical protein